MPVQILTRRQSVQAAGRASKEPKHIDYRGDLIPQRAVQWLTAVQGFESGKLVGMRFNNVSQFQQAFGTRFGRGLPPLCERPIGCLHGRVDLRG